jgi:predicted DsbA family dithiol-disulfide isomerase
VEPVRFVVYSDYLCPWCYNASVRLHRLEDETQGAVRLEWRSFLLRPQRRPGRDLERFREYTRTWLRPAQEPDAGTFQVWQGQEGPPSHSLPAHLAARAAAALAPGAFRRMHDRLLRAYFAENRDISDFDTLLALWTDLGLPEDGFARTRDPALASEVLTQHREALESGVTGVPAVRRADDDAVIVGAQPYELYRRWFERTRARMEENRDG